MMNSQIGLRGKLIICAKFQITRKDDFHLDFVATLNKYYAFNLEKIVKPFSFFCSEHFKLDGVCLFLTAQLLLFA